MADAPPPPPPPPPPPAPPPSSPTRQPQPPAAPRAGPAAPRQKPKKLSTAAKRASDARKSGDAKRQSGGRKSGERQSLGKSGELLKGPALAISKLGRRLSVRRDALTELQKVPAHMTGFVNAESVENILRTFGQICAAGGVEAGAGRATLGALTKDVVPRLPHRLKGLFKALNDRVGRPEYGGVGAEARRELAVSIVGAGPIGLRCAIELALLGCRVRLLEKRAEFTRLNVLHLWEWVEEDLKDLGVKTIDASIFASADYVRVGTCQLQHSLLKLALLVGVHVDFGDNGNASDAAAAAAAGGGAPHVLIDATGARCPLFDRFGFEQQPVLKAGRALGIVCHLPHGGSPVENKLRQSTWSHQYFQQQFKSLHDDHGVELQNCVYYRSTGAFAPQATHYFVMTGSLASLVAAGALRSADVPELCAGPNVDRDRLGAYARAAVAAFVPELAGHALLDGTLQIFDFSERKQSNAAAVVVPSERFDPAGAAAAAAEPVLVTRVGDALQEPFWPEGLGINRGFLHVLDCADLVTSYAAARHEAQRADGSVDGAALGAAAGRLVAQREALFAYTKRVSGSNRRSELRPEKVNAEYAYRIDPGSRYKNLRPNWREAA